MRQPGTTIYLDYNATSPAKPAVIDAVADALREGGNASSIHRLGRTARARVEEARLSVAALVGAAPGQIVFTGSGTEANNQALRRSERRRLLVSAIEHESVLLARDDRTLLPVGADGTLDLDALDRALLPDGGDAQVAVMLANNETGVIQPIAEIVEIAHRRGALVHCDAVQAAGKVPVDFAALGVDTMAVAAHKFSGPQGIGALIARAEAPVGRLIHGGGQERGLRAGTESVAAIAGFGVAARLALDGLDEFAGLARLRDGLEARIRALAPGSVVFGETATRLPNTAKLTMPGVSSETQVMALDLAGIAVSAGSACSAGKVEPPYVLTAMGVPDALAVTAIRVSLGWRTVAEDIDRLVDAWAELYRRAGERAA